METVVVNLDLWMGRGNSSLVILLDICVAFDTTDQFDIEVRVGTEEIILKWYQPFLSQQTQRVSKWQF